MDATSAVSNAGDSALAASPGPPPQHRHPFRLFRKKGNKKMTKEAKRRLCIQYLQQESEEFCRYWVASSKNKTVFSKCNCCAWLSSPTKFDERDAIANFMLVWYDKIKTKKQQIMKEWIRYTKELNHHRKYFIPLIDQ